MKKNKNLWVHTHSIFVPLLYAKILAYFCARTIPLHPRANATWYSRSWNKISSRGITLIDVMIGCFIVTVGVLVIVQVFSATVNFNMRSRRTIEAINLTQTILEDLKNYNFDELDKYDKATVNTGVFTDKVLPTTALTDKYSALIRVENADFANYKALHPPYPDPPPKLKKITVILNWKEVEKEKEVEAVGYARRLY